METIKVLIVDDDKIIVNDLKEMIDWNANGFEIVDIAFNGKTGIRYCEEKEPHIVLTDIKMPIMDGLEMIRFIKSNHYNTEVIILSSYGEFSYAQEAIQLGAQAYVLKGKLNDQVLLEALLSVKSNIVSCAQNAFLSIYTIVGSCVEEKHSNLQMVFSNLSGAFDLYIEGIENWGLHKLTEQTSELIEKSYKNHGKSPLFTYPRVMSKTDLHHWIQQQLQLIYRWIEEEEKSDISPSISRAMLYIEKNYGQKELNVKDMADTLAISISWLSVRFKKETGFTLKEYIKKIRIEQAKLLLRQDNHRVYEVADLVGFTSSQYFSKIFYQETNQFPQYYRKDFDA